MPPLTVEQQAFVIEGYVNRVIENMDSKDIEILLYDLFCESLGDQTEAEIKDLIVSVYDEEFYEDLVAEATA
jgi:hypothetical protein